MDLITLLLVALSLAMDALAVSVTNGIRLNNCRVADGVKMGLFFGIFQFIMPLLGFYLGGGVIGFVGKFAPWLSCAILVFLGVRMMVEANKAEEEEDDGTKQEKLGFYELFLQAVATSIDALAVGLSLAMTGGYREGYLYFASAVIGIVAFVCSFTGAMAGKKLGGLFEKRAGTVGGAVLVVIGLKILIESFIK